MLNTHAQSDFLHFLVRTKESWLLLLTREHYFVKKSSKKSAMNFLLCNRGGIKGIFLLFRKVFNFNQYDFGLVLLSNNLSDKREWHFCVDSLIVDF